MIEIILSKQSLVPLMVCAVCVIVLAVLLLAPSLPAIPISTDTAVDSDTPTIPARFVRVSHEPVFSHYSSSSDVYRDTTTGRDYLVAYGRDGVYSVTLVAEADSQYTPEDLFESNDQDD